MASQATSHHIAVITSSYPAGPGDPSGHFIEAEVNALLRAGHHVTLLAPGKALSGACPQAHTGELSVTKLCAGTAFGWPGMLARLAEDPRRSRDVFHFVRAARAHLSTLRVDQVIAHWLCPGLWPIAFAARAPILAVAHGSDVHYLRKLPEPLLRRALNAALRRDVRFRFVSRRLLNELCDAVGEPWATDLAARSTVRPSPVDTTNTPDKTEARRRLRLNDEFIALCVGRLIPGKNVTLALRAAPVPSGARWVIIGDGPEHAQLSNAHPEAQFLGRLDRTTTLLWLSAADVLVHASEREGAPSVIREARQLGTPVWSSDTGDVREWAASDPGIRVLDFNA